MLHAIFMRLRFVPARQLEEWLILSDVAAIEAINPGHPPEFRIHFELAAYVAVVAFTSRHHPPLKPNLSQANRSIWLSICGHLFSHLDKQRSTMLRKCSFHWSLACSIVESELHYDLAMDISRPDLKVRKQRRTWTLAAVAVLVVAVVAFFVVRLKPAVPSVERSAIWTDVVKRGPLVRQVRGPGSLVPREDRLRLIPAETEATVVRIRVLPGTKVTADTVLMDLVDPTLTQELLDAQLQLKAALADLENTRAKVNSDLMTQRAGAATVGADQQQALLQAQTDKSLYDLGVISGLTYSASKGKSDELKQRDDLEKQRLTLNQASISTQLAVSQTKVDQAKAILSLKQRQLDALSVKAGIDGVLVDLPLPHQVGEHVAPGTTLAKVVQPDQLKASLKIAETQARDIQIGQPAEVDTHNGVIPGKVTRIDGAVQNGTVTVDVELAGALPQGARPDLSVDGTIDLDRMADVVYVGRPALGPENSTISLFRLSADGTTAVKVPVKVGRASVNSIQVLEGLQPGDTVVLSDMSRWDSNDRLRIE
jgi:HlyD family secretion protein